MTANSASAVSRKVGLPLAVGIALLPFVFVWLLLRKGYSLVARLAGFGWLGLVIVVSALGSSKPSPQSPKPNSPAQAISAAPAATVTLATYKAKVSPDAVSDLTRSAYPKLFAKVGAAKFALSNDLDDWAGLLAAMSPKCDRVDLVNISDEATAKALRWHVDCANGERFYVSEADASATKARFENAGASSPIAPPLNAPAPQSAALANFKELTALNACEDAMKARLKSPSSYRPKMGWRVIQSKALGQVTITREFDAKNAFNAELHSTWTCSVNPGDNSVLELSVQE